MKRKSVLGTVFTLALIGGALTACSTASATSPVTTHNTNAAIYSTVAQGLHLTSAAQSIAGIDTSKNPYDTDAKNLTTQSNRPGFAPANFTVEEADWQTDDVPACAMTAEEAARIAEQYIWDVFGKSIEGMYVTMSYSDCWLRPSKGRWTGSVSLTPQDMEAYHAYVICSSLIDIKFTFTIDSITGERLEISYHPLGSPPVNITHDTQPLWESPKGLAIQAMDDNELADFVGIAPEQLEIYIQEAYELAQAHFANTTVKNVALGRNVTTPTGPMQLPGIFVLLDTNADGSIFGTYTGLEFTVTNHEGSEAIVTITEWHQGYRAIRIWSVFDDVNVTEDSLSRSATPRNIPEELREMWEADDAEVYRLRALNVPGSGISPDDFPPYALWTRAEMLDAIGRAVEIEAHHYAMSRDELAARAAIATMLIRASFLEPENAFHVSFFEWVRENYTEENIAIYEEMGAPQWLVDRLMLEISTR